tara:strand:+ start:19663 stop:22698 length:3036 start_codon:yes stop_codon:yes gene_type:complete
MAFTLSDEYKEHMGRASAEPVVQVAVQTVAPSAQSFYAHNGYNGVDATVAGDPILASVTSVSNSLDPVTRKNQVSSIQFEFLDDGYIRSLAASYKFYNAYVLVSVGSADMITTDYCPVFFGRVSRSWSEAGKLIFEATDYEDIILGKFNFRTYFNKHPLEVLLQALQDCGIPAARIDSTSFAFNSVAESSHYVFNSYPGNTYGEPQNELSKYAIANGLPEGDHILVSGYHSGLPSGTISSDYMGYGNTTLLVVRPEKFLKEYLEMTRSVLRADVVNNKLKMVKPLASDAVAKHFTTDEYSDFEMDSNTVIFNRCSISVGVGDAAVKLSFEDDTSVAAFGEFTYETDTAYLSAGSDVSEDAHVTFEDGALGPMSLTSAGISGFCGTRNLHAGTQVAADQIDSDNPSYSLYLKAIYKGTSAITASGPAHGQQYWAFDTAGGEDTRYDGPSQINLNGLTKVTGDDAPTNNEGLLWHDITIPYNFAQELLERFSNGAPKIKFFTGLDNINLELGDLISIDNDWFISSELGLTSLDSNVKFEITKKEVNLTGATIGVQYEAVYMTKTSAPSVSISWIPSLDVLFSPIIKKDMITQNYSMASEDSVFNGLEVSATSGLGFQIEPGKLLGKGVGSLLQNAQTFTATASKHTYIGFNAASGTIVQNEVSTSADEPELLPGEIRLAKVVSDGSSVTSVIDLRRIGAITASQFNRELLAPANGILWNGDFEDWANPGAVPMGWTETGNGAAGTDTEREVSVVHSGRYALKMNDTSESVVWFSGFIPIDNTQPYRVSLWARQAGSVTMRSDIFWYTAEKVAASTSSTSITNAACAANNVWENRTTIVEPGSDVAYAKLKITRPVSPGHKCYWDDITIKPEPISFRARAPSAGGGSSITKDTDTDLIFGTDVHDYGAVHDTSNGRFTAPSAGLYEFNLTVQVTCTGGEASMIAGYLFKNGSKFAVALGGTHSAGAFSASVTVSSGPMELAAGDYITPGVFVGNRNATLAADPDDSYFSGRKIS